LTRPASSRRGGSSEGSSIRAVFYFDLGSPYAYLAAERIGRLFPEPPLWQPILLGGLFKRLGAAVKSPAVKDALHAATEHAGDLGVRGMPSLLVGSTIYFGDDRLDAAAAAAKRHGRERS